MPARLLLPATRLRIESLEDRTTPASWGLDPTFAAEGIATIPVGASSAAFGLARTPDGKYVAAGYGSTGAQNGISIVRVTADGLPDPTFSDDGSTVVPIGTGGALAWSVAVQTDGKVVAAGYGADGPLWPLALVRLNPDGSLDPTFGTGGKVSQSLGGRPAAFYSVAVQPDGKVVVGVLHSERVGRGLRRRPVPGRRVARYRVRDRRRGQRRIRDRHLRRRE